MKIKLRQVFMTSAMLVMAVPIAQFPDNRQLTLWSSCSTTIALFVVQTFGEPHRDHRVLDGFPMATLTVRTLLSWMWMTSPL